MKSAVDPKKTRCTSENELLLFTGIANTYGKPDLTCMSSPSDFSEDDEDLLALT